MVQQTNQNSKQPAEHIVVNCRECDGTGDCSTCQGDGGICPFCEGLGACRRCQGSGRVNELSDSEWVASIVQVLNDPQNIPPGDLEINSVMVAKWRRRLTTALDKIGRDLDALVAYDMAFNHLVTVMADVAVGLQPHPDIFAQAWARLRAAERDVFFRMKPAPREVKS